MTDFQRKGEDAERFVHHLASNTFFVDWCFLNPLWPDGKELCDMLVVFDDVAIIWQIKDLKLNKHGRYNEREINKNRKQLSGAKRKLFSLKQSINLLNARRTIEEFNTDSIKKIFLISALMGDGDNSFSITENLGGDVIHVFTRNFVTIALNELDTVSDFIQYLGNKENFLQNKKSLVIHGGEEDLLAIYLKLGKSFKELYNDEALKLEAGLWKSLQNSPEYQAKKKENEISYGWDKIVNRAHEGSKRYELVARELARPNRLQRRTLSKAFLKDLMKANQLLHKGHKRVVIRSILCMEGVTYCFLFIDEPKPKNYRKSMLKAMCWIARGKYEQNKKVVGIATEISGNQSCSYDFALIDKPTLTKAEQLHMLQLQKDTGIYSNIQGQYKVEVEYPR